MTDTEKNKSSLSFSVEKLKTIDMFSALQKDSLDKIATNGEIFKYREGWPLSNLDMIQNNILVILEGEARLIGLENNRITTIVKLGKGYSIGLASILRCSPCENVTASTELVALSIPDKTILDIYKNDNAFKLWCDRNLFPSELASFIEVLSKGYPNHNLNIKKVFSYFYQSKKIKCINSDFKNSNKSNNRYYIGSLNIENKNIGDEINDYSEVKSKPPFTERIIEIPKDLLEIFITSKSQSKPETNILNKKEKDNVVIFNDSTPVKTNLDFESNLSKPKFKLVKGSGTIKETLACLEMLSNELNIPFRKDTVERILKEEYERNNNLSIQLISSILSMVGLYTSTGIIPTNLGNRLPLRCLIKWKDSLALVKNVSSNGLELASPSKGIVHIRNEDLDKNFNENIEILLVEKSSLTPNKKFGINWFVPSLKKYKSSLLLVLIASFVVQLFGLANPLLIQVIIDKVISQRSLDTLQVLGYGLVIVTIIGGILGSLRTFLFTETTNRIDTRLAAEVIDHLLRVPLKYFDKRPVGELGSRVGELEKIRDFLTGQALTTMLDAIFSIIYIVVMVLYSWLLTFIALAVVPIQIGLTLLGSPLIRSQIRNVANQNAKTQSHLVEVLTGIQTVKAQNIETVTRWKWQDLYAGYISKSFAKTITSTGLSQTSQVLQQLSQLLVLWVGATLVLDGKLSLGQLIAFRIISGYVTQPLLRLSSIWQNLQELKVSFERLADIIDTPEESNEIDKKKITLPLIKGSIEFKDVSFSFNRGSKEILSKINLKIPSSEFVGIAGQSGSGKSTLMKLLPRLYELDQGKILIDGYDINKVELYSLRKQIGIVPQEPLLFSGSVSENIAISDNNIKESEIIRAAKIANAHDFIMELPDGYSTDVGERGSRLSGGQRQRIAIARTIVSRPKLLIMDEATSALDYDTEKKVCQNLKENCKDLTVFFITHRLSTIKNADKIVMMNEGSISEIGTHDELMSMLGRYYALYRQQESQ